MNIRFLGWVTGRRLYYALKHSIWTGGVTFVAPGVFGGIRRYRDVDRKRRKEEKVREESHVVDVAAVLVPLEAHQGEAQRVT